MNRAFFRWTCPFCMTTHTRVIEPEVLTLALLTVTTYEDDDLLVDIGDPRRIVRQGDVCYRLLTPVDLTCDAPDVLIPNERSTP